MAISIVGATSQALSGWEERVNEALNPSFETNTDNWAIYNGGGGTPNAIDQVEGALESGDYCGEFSGTNDGSVRDKWLIGNEGSEVACAPGEIWYLRARITGHLDGTSWKLKARDDGGDNTDVDTSTTTDPDGELLEGFFTVPGSGYDAIGPTIVQRNVPASASWSVKVDGVMLVKVAHAVPVPYFDGDTFGYSWQGTEHESPSERTFEDFPGLVIPRPAEATFHDTLVACVVAATDTATIIAPEGWTLAGVVSINSEAQLAVYHRVAEAGEPDSYTWSFDETVEHLGGIVAVRGVDPLAPVLDFAAQDNASSLSVTCPSVVPGVADAMLLFGGAIVDGATVSFPGPATEQLDIRSGDYEEDRSLSIGTEQLSGAGATGTRTITNEDTYAFGGVENGGMAIVLKPVAERTLNAKGIEMIDSIPPQLRAAHEYQGVMHAQSQELTRLEAAIEQIRDNTFPQKADIALAIWETLVKTTLNPAGKTDPQRQAIVVALLRKLLTSASGADWIANATLIIGSGQWSYREHDPDDVDGPPPYTVWVFLAVEPEEGNYAQIEAFLRATTPANTDLVIGFEEGFILGESELGEEAV